MARRRLFAVSRASRKRASSLAACGPWMRGLERQAVSAEARARLMSPAPASAGSPRRLSMSASRALMGAFASASRAAPAAARDGEAGSGGALDAGPGQELGGPLPLRLQGAHLVDRVARERSGCAKLLRRGDEALPLLGGILIGLRERFFERPQRCSEARFHGLLALLSLTRYGVLDGSQLPPGDLGVFDATGEGTPVGRGGIEFRSCFGEAFDDSVARGEVLAARGL